MNLHAIANGLVSSVNRNRAGTLLISSGYSIGANGRQSPAYETPGAFVGSISGTTLTVTASTQGKLAAGQKIAGAGVSARTVIVRLGTGAGGAGTYFVNLPQTVASVAMTSTMPISAQVQDLSQRDLMHLDALNVQGSTKSIYLFGGADAVVRVNEKGGDLVKFGDETWLVTAVFEKWPGWCKISATLQNGG